MTDRKTPATEAGRALIENDLYRNGRMKRLDLWNAILAIEAEACVPAAPLTAEAGLCDTACCDYGERRHIHGLPAAPAAPQPDEALRAAATVLCGWIDALERRAHGEFGVWHEETMVAEARDELRAALAAAPQGLDVELLEAVEDVLFSDDLEDEPALHWEHLRRLVNDRRDRLKEKV